jgi:putative tryptophan/tyrosine transport system substrate-binding protein
VQSFAHPGGNVTGFAVMEPSLGAKLLGMLKQIAPQVTHVAVLMNPDSGTHKRILALLEAAAFPAFPSTSCRHPRAKQPTSKQP